MRRPLSGLLSTLLASAACSSGGDGGTDPVGSIAISLASSSATIQQGGSSTVGATLTRAGGFTGAVNLTVEGAPTGASATVGGVSTSGSTTTATVTILVGAATPAGTYPLTVRGTATGLTDATAAFSLTVTAAPAGSFALAVSPAGGVSMVQGTIDASKTITITRTNYTAAITFTTENLPTGLTASYTPNGTATNSSVLTLTATAGLTPNVYNITIRGTGPAALRLPGDLASVEAATVLAVTVTAAVAGSFTLTTTPGTSTSVVQGANGNVTVNINRTGGNTSSIALTATGTLPTGMSLSFAPASTTTNSSVLTITTTGATPVGATAIVIRGNTAGLSEQTVNLTINVTAAGGGASVTLNWAACGANAKPVFVAYQDGAAGPWVRSTGVADVYQFNITQGKGGYAYVTVNPNNGNPTISILLQTQAELSAGSANFCAGTTPVLKNLTGSVTNLPAGMVAQIGFAGSSTQAAVNGPIALNNARDGDFDLVAYAKTPAVVGGGDRMFLDRPLNPANGGSVGTVDFLHASKAFTPAVGTMNLTGTVGGETVSHSMSFSAGTGPTICTATGLYFGTSVVGSSFNAYGVPIGRHIAGDAHLMTVTSSGTGSNFRSVSEYVGDLVTRAATPVVLPAAAPVPTITDAGGPYKRPSVVMNGIDAAFNTSATFTYIGQTFRGGFISASGGWVAGPNVTLTLPDFSALTGWDNAWAPTTGDQVSLSLSVAGTSAVTTCAAGNRSVTAARGPFTI